MTTDYHNFTNKDTPVAERRRLNVGDVWLNQVKCLKCNITIRSKNRHDYVQCKCGNIAVDGGSWYCKRVGNGGNYEELSESYNAMPKKEEVI